MATKVERELERDKKIQQALEKINEVSEQIKELVEKVNEQQTGKKVKKTS